MSQQADLSTARSGWTAEGHRFPCPSHADRLTSLWGGKIAPMSDNHEVLWGERPAVPAPPDLHARYETDGGTYATSRIYAFNADGYPLVLGDTRLVRPEVAETKMTYVGVHTPYGPPLTGPFTTAPTGLVAVFSDGREQPVLFYDVHGRAVVMDTDDVTCDLALAESLVDLVRVDFPPTPDESAASF